LPLVRASKKLDSPGAVFEGASSMSPGGKSGPEQLARQRIEPPGSRLSDSGLASSLAVGAEVVETRAAATSK